MKNASSSCRKRFYFCFFTSCLLNPDPPHSPLLYEPAVLCRFLKCFALDQVGELIGVVAEDGEDWRTVGAADQPAAQASQPPPPVPAGRK